MTRMVVGLGVEAVCGCSRGGKRNKMRRGGGNGHERSGSGGRRVGSSPPHYEEVGWGAYAGSVCRKMCKGIKGET